MVALLPPDRQRVAVAIVASGGARIHVAIRVQGFGHVGGGESHRHLVDHALVRRWWLRRRGGHDNLLLLNAAGSWTGHGWSRGRRRTRRRTWGRRHRRRGVGVGPLDLDNAVWVCGAVQLLRQHALEERDHPVSVLRSVGVTAAERKHGGDGVDLYNPSSIRKRRKRGQARRGQRGRRLQLQIPAVFAVVAGIALRAGKAIGVRAVSGAVDVGEYGA